MKKNIIFTLTFALAFGAFIFNSAKASYYEVTPKLPQANAATKAGILKYKQQNYVGAMQDLEAVLAREPKNQMCKYYLAMTYAKLGYSSKATEMYQDLADNGQNAALKYYAKYALDCTGNADSDVCQAYNAKPSTQAVSSNSDISDFIRSGKTIHPSAMDKITNERMIRKVQEAEYLRKQQETNNPNEKLKSDNDMPTNEEIMKAIDTLKKVGLDPISRDYTAYIMQDELLGDKFNETTQNQFSAVNRYSSPEYLKMLMLSQMTEQNNMYANAFNYGI